MACCCSAAAPATCSAAAGCSSSACCCSRFASGLGGLAQGETWLILARLLQGVGAAIASPTALSLITTTFPAGPARNRAIAVYGAMSGAGAAIGLILGGALTQIHSGDNYWGWRLTLLINVPIGLFVAFLAPRVLGESEPQKGIALDLPGALAATAGLASLVYGLTHAAGDLKSSNWGHDQHLGLHPARRRADRRLPRHRGAEPAAAACRCTSCGTAPAGSATS